VTDPDLFFECQQRGLDEVLALAGPEAPSGYDATPSPPGQRASVSR